MPQNVSRFFALAVLLVVALTGCASKTPLEQALASRAAYKATLNSFFVKETPLVEEAPEAALADEEAAEDSEGAEDPAGAEENEAEGETAEAMPVPTRQDVVLDIIVQHDSNDPLPGVTLDITMVDEALEEIGSWKMWADTEGLPKANQRTFSHVLEGIDFQEGHGFNVEVRSGLDPSEYADYKELPGS